MNDPSIDGLSIPTTHSTSDQEVRKSRFIGHAYPVSNTADVRGLIDRMRTEYPDATHVAHAYLIGPRASQTAGLSDDGEPKGTAGKPILDMIQGRSISNVLVMVVRYFGGTKLGTGGLVRAYGDCARRTLDLLVLEPFITFSEFRIVLSYDLYDAASRIIRDHGAKNLEEEFGLDIRIRGKMPLQERDRCNLRLADISRGALQLESESGDE